MSNQHDLILDQFTRQAVPFSTAATITDENALKLIVAAGQPAPDQTMLDVACGGGIVVCAFAPHVRHATGIDMTPAMLERAASLATGRSLANVGFQQGDAAALPYPDATFGIVTTRFSFHHFPDPLTVLREMRRVCAPGGRIVVVDMYASEDRAKAAAWNQLERLRDPSHVRCLSLSELRELFHAAELPTPETTFYKLSDLVSNLLARSFPNPGDDTRIIEMFAASAADDRLGIPVSSETGALRYAYRVAILAANRP
jgi:ubiquinone/menaquinone biosynthesis C-methylase UbiE